ncbi:hypothetical protein P9D42_15430 [Bacillus haynesii]|uniref:hypothetical protein n=1 Tax=Bacillus haynesii TaxID=1925021 RepID=UPI002DBBB28B|nr:hypothetical protein [Bacillus haynesii]MEC1507036.1 hypothetical protein [Bacillus haynesii]
MSEIIKPVITKEQARAIDEGIKCYARQGLDIGPNLYNRFMIDHANVLTKVDDPWTGVFSCLNDLDLMTLAAALINGYEVEKTPEEKVREYYEELCDEFDCAYWSSDEIKYLCKKQAVRETLDKLGMKIEGVNA